MKKIIFSLMLLAALFTSCDLISNIGGYDAAKLNITLYANDTEVEGGFTFNATEEWSTFVEYKGEESDWISIDPASGSAGKVTMHIYVNENNTGESRSAVVHIVCGASNLNINLVQKATENNGVENGDDNDFTHDNDTVNKLDRVNYAISSITKIVDNQSRYTIYFDRDKYKITRIRAENVRYEIEDETYWLNINVYQSDELIGKIESNKYGNYVDFATFTSYVQSQPSTGGDITTEEYIDQIYFERNEFGFLSHTEHTANGDKVTHYNLEWEESNLSRVIKVEPEHSYITEITYYENLITPQHLRETYYKDYIDLNQLIFQETHLYWVFGTEALAYLGYACNTCYNMVKSITSQDYGSIDVEYKLNDIGLVGEIILSNGYSFQINYTEI